MKSVYLVEFENKLKDDRLKLISFDIFDTLFFRKCGQPSSIFYFVGKHKDVQDIYGEPEVFKNYRIEAERLARKLYADKEEINFHDIYMQMGLAEDLIEVLQQIELDAERDNLVVNPEMLNFIDLALKLGKRVILVSDMYLSQEQLEYVCLGRLPNRNGISSVYVSSEYGLTKASGSFFNTIMERECVESGEVLHIGDNLISDYSMPMKFGISALLYNCPEVFSPMKEHEKLYTNEDDLYGSHIRRCAVLAQPYSQPMEKFYYTFSTFILGPLIYHFNLWLHDLAESRGSDKIHFVMREGWLLQKFFNLQFPEFSTNLLFLSRDSSLPLLGNEEGAERLIESIIRQGMYKVEDLYEKLGMPLVSPSVVKHKYARLNESWKISVDNKTLLEFIRQDLDLYRDQIVVFNNEKRKLVVDYLNQSQIKINDLVLDFGPSGTVFNRLGCLDLISALKLNYALFYMGGHGYEKQVGNRALAFLSYNDKSRRHIDNIKRTPGLFEIIVNLDHQTTTSYVRSNNKVCPVLSCKTFNLAEIKQFKEPVLSGIKNYFKYAEYFSIQSPLYNRNYLSMLMARVLGFPTEIEINWFSMLMQDEGDGSSEVFNLIKQSDLDEVLADGLEKSYLESLVNKEKRVWFEGAITKIDSQFLFRIFNYHASANLANKTKIDILIDQIRKMKVKEVVIYGAGDFYRELSVYLKLMNVRVRSLIDLRAEFGDFFLDGLQVLTMEKALSDEDNIYIVIASSVYAKDIKEKILCFQRERGKSFNIISC